MELAVVLVLLFIFLIGFKLLGIFFKAAFFLITIPFQIFGAVLGVVLVIAVFPFAALAGFLTLILAPLFIIGPLIPFFLVAFGFYLIVRH